ncbi:MAG TPA: chromate transporter [Chthonomonadaceae bacterium]|nr:chromate transporter [Chthonomonadaceae bacterium]
MNPWLSFWLFLKASLFSTGGMGNLPSLHNDLLARRWATERQFAESLLIGQLAPGPNGFWVLSLGFLTDGLRGALLALLAINLPPMLILLVERLYRHVKEHPAVEGFMRGMSLALTGMFAITMYRLLRGGGLDVRTVLIALAAVGLGATRRVPLIVIVALAAVAGVLFTSGH